VKDSRDTCGQAYGLTVLTPILDGHESELASYLDGLQGGAESPMASVPGTHFARWVVIGDVVYEGGRQRRDRLRFGRLLFSSNFDGHVEPYLEALRTGLGEAADAIWSHCGGYPGSADSAAFIGYMRTHQIESSLFFSAYGERTVDQVTGSLAVRRQLIDFALRAQGMAPSLLQSEFWDTFRG
jgi:hypothetical protein